MIFHQLYCRKCNLFFMTKTTKESCPICGWTMLADYHKDNKFNFNGRNKMDVHECGKLKVYIAASYPRKQEANALGSALEKKGFEVLSYWHQIVDDADYLSGPKAIRDMFAVQNCDLFIEFVGDADSKGGRHCELGLALAWNKKVILIGKAEDYCIFANLPWLPRMKNAEELLRKIV